MDSTETKEEITILDLNDDCLATILKYMDFENLLNIFSCHSHFHNAIRVSMGNECINLLDDEYYGKKMRFCELFGSQVKHLHLYGGATEIYKSIMQYFSGGNVKKLQFSGKLSEIFLKENINLFKSLTSFKLHGEMDIGGLKTLLCAATYLVELDIGNLRTDDCHAGLLSQILSLKLEKLILKDFENIAEEKINELPLNTTVKDLTLTQCNKISILTRFVGVEYLNVPGLELTGSIVLNKILNVPKLKGLSLADTEVGWVDGHYDDDVDAGAVRNDDEFDDDWPSDVTNNCCGKFFDKLIELNTLEKLSVINIEVDGDTIIRDRVWDGMYLIKSLKSLELNVSIQFFGIFFDCIPRDLINLQEFKIYQTLERKDLYKLITFAQRLNIIHFKAATNGYYSDGIGKYDSEYDEIYEELAEIREDQNKKDVILYINIRDEQREIPIYIEKCKWVKLSVAEFN